MIFLFLFVSCVMSQWFQGPCSSRAQVERNEGYKNTVHSVSGIKHVCYGFNLEKAGAASALSAQGLSHSAIMAGQAVPKAKCDALLAVDMATATNCARSFVSNYNALSDSRKSAIIDMAYNLGCAGLGQFRNFKAAVESSSWSRAAAEIENSNYCNQVGCRCDANKYCMDYCQPRPCSSRMPSGVPSCGGSAPLPTNPPAPQTCRYSSFVDSGPCTAPCGQSCSTCQRQTRAVISGTACTGNTVQNVRCTGAPCPTSAPCSYSGWTDAGSCSATRCGTSGTMPQTRRVIAGSACTERLSQSVACSAPSCPAVNCQWAEWSNWGLCSVSCGTGTQVRNRGFRVPASNGGQPCLGLPSDSQSCTKACTGGGGGGSCTPKDCVLSEWSTGGPCVFASKRRRSTEAACPGMRTLTRSIVSPPAACGGAACPGPEGLTMKEPCSEPCDNPNNGTPNNGNGDGNGVDPNTRNGNGNGVDPINGGGNVVSGPQEQVVVGPKETAAESEGGLQTAHFVGIAAVGLCCILLVVGLIVCVAVGLGTSSTKTTGGVVHAPRQDALLVGNPLFETKENKVYNPLFYAGGDGTGTIGAGGDGMVSARAAPMSPGYGAGSMYGSQYGTAGGDLMQSAVYEQRGDSDIGAALGMPSGYSASNTCVICNKAYPSAADLNHHVQKRHVDLETGVINYGGAQSAYPSAGSSAYPSGSIAYPSGSAAYPSGSDASAYPSGTQSAYPSGAAPGLAPGSPDGYSTNNPYA